MIINKVANKYAATLLDSTFESKNFQEISNDVEAAIEIIRSSRELSVLISNPVYDSIMKLSVLKAVFGDKISLELLSFIEFLVKKDRINLLSPILQKFLELRDDRLGIINAEVKSAFELDEDQKNMIKVKLESLTGKKIRLKTEVDNSLLGGFVALAGDKLYDASLINQLDVLKKKFHTSGVVLN